MQPPTSVSLVVLQLRDVFPLCCLTYFMGKTYTVPCKREESIRKESPNKTNVSNNLGKLKKKQAHLFCKAMWYLLLLALFLPSAIFQHLLEKILKSSIKILDMIFFYSF